MARPSERTRVMRRAGWSAARRFNRPSGAILGRLTRRIADRSARSGSLIRTSVRRARSSGGKSREPSWTSSIEATLVFYEGEDFVFRGHEVRATVLSDEDGAYGIAHTKRAVPFPSAEATI